jgi:hypothetical protein
VHVRELLSYPQLQEVLADQYRHGIRSAQRNYLDSAADEDAVTGALGQALTNEGTLFIDGVGRVRWETRYKKFRGRGGGAGEKRLGGDGVFEIRLHDEVGLESRKSLVFQAKNKKLRLKESGLRHQAEQIASLPGGGLVIYYSDEGYTAFEAGAVVNGTANPREDEPLAEFLADGFLKCTRGSFAYYYDAHREAIVLSTPDGDVVIRDLPLGIRVRTQLCVVLI